MRKIDVIIKRADSKPYHTAISDSLKNLQTIVGGYIETVGLFSNMIIICNEEGLIRGLPYNCNICGVDFYGDIIFVGVKGDEFDDIPCTFQQFKETFPRLFDMEDHAYIVLSEFYDDDEINWGGNP